MRPRRWAVCSLRVSGIEICAVPETTSMLTSMRPEMPIASRTGLGNTIRPTSSTVTVVFIGTILPIGTLLARQYPPESRARPSRLRELIAELAMLKADELRLVKEKLMQLEARGQQQEPRSGWGAALVEMVGTADLSEDLSLQHDPAALRLP